MIAILLSLFLLSKPSVAADHYVIGCMVYNSSFTLLHSYPGTMCAFFPDGSYVRYQPKQHEISRINANGEIKWKRIISAHHQLKISADGKKILTLAKDFHNGAFCRVGYDDFYALDSSNGNVLYRWSGFEHRQELLKIAGRLRFFSLNEDGSTKGHDCELSHFNSIDEIPPNPLEKSNSAFKKGNYIVSLNGLPVFAVLDSRMKKLIWISRPSNHFLSYHDIQMLPSGEILLYRNTQRNSSEEVVSAGYISRFDPLSGKEAWRYPALEANDSYPVGTYGSGGAQALPEGILFNTNSTRNSGGAIYFVDFNGRKKWEIPSPFKNSAGLPAKFQDVKRIDLTEFLKNQKDL